MRKIFLFMNVSLDGYVEAPGHDISGFSHEFEAFSPESSSDVDGLLYGHRTYEMMKFWGTPEGAAMAPEVARFMSEKQKYVASHHDFDPGWQNVTVLTGDVVAQVKALKEGPGKTIGIFGSNSLCVTLIQAGLIDEFQIQVNPVVFGAGTSLFAGLPQGMPLKLKEARPFKSGAVLMTYSSL